MQPATCYGEEAAATVMPGGLVSYYTYPLSQRDGQPEAVSLRLDGCLLHTTQTCVDFRLVAR